jgi:tetratricopeptide (TPR) repeat protein
MTGPPMTGPRMTGRRMTATEVGELLAAARAAVRGGDPRRAASLARRASDLAPDAPEAAFLACRCLLDLRDPAANTMLERLERFPGHATGWRSLGVGLLGAGQPGAALVAFSRAAAADPSSVDALMGQATARAALGRHAEAAAACETAARLAPRVREIAWRHGQYLREAGASDAALAAFRRALAIDPGYADAWFSLGLLLQDRHETASAASAFAEALAARPDWHEAALNLGIARQDDGDLDGAMAAYGIAYRLRPEAFGRIAQSLVSAPTGRLWLDLDRLRDVLAHAA